ncbi:hypothetical protein MXB_3316, partial [Myxobolus squamalis]
MNSIILYICIAFFDQIIGQGYNSKSYNSRKEQSGNSGLPPLVNPDDSRTYSSGSNRVQSSNGQSVQPKHYQKTLKNTYKDDYIQADQYAKIDIHKSRQGTAKPPRQRSTTQRYPTTTWRQKTTTTELPLYTNIQSVIRNQATTTPKMSQSPGDSINIDVNQIVEVQTGSKSCDGKLKCPSTENKCGTPIKTKSKKNLRQMRRARAFPCVCPRDTIMSGNNSSRKNILSSIDSNETDLIDVEAIPFYIIDLIMESPKSQSFENMTHSDMNK